MKLVRKIALAALLPIASIALAILLAPSAPTSPSLVGWLAGLLRAA